MPLKRKGKSREFIDDSDDPEDTGVSVEPPRFFMQPTSLKTLFNSPTLPGKGEGKEGKDEGSRC